MADVDRLLRAAPFDAEEALVGVSLLVAATNWFVLMRAHASASLEREGGQAAFRRHDEDVFAAVLLAHVAFRFVELVVGAADKATRILGAIGLAVSGHDTVLKGHGDDAKATGLLLHLAHTLVGVSIGSADWRELLLLGCALRVACGVVLAESRARSNVCHLHSTPEKMRKVVCEKYFFWNPIFIRLLTNK